MFLANPLQSCLIQKSGGLLLTSPGIQALLFLSLGSRAPSMFTQGAAGSSQPGS